MPVTRCFWCGRVSAVCFSRFYLLSPVPFCSFFTPSAVYMPVARVPAVPPRASQPFPQFERAAGFTGFTLTPLTPRPRPPTATHPAAGQSRDAHVAITHRLARDWPRPATPLILIGCVLPPARPLWISFLCFLFFSGALSWSQSAGSGSALRLKLQSLFTELLPTLSPLLRPLFLFVNSASLLSGQFPETWNVRTVRYLPGLQNLRVRGPVSEDGAVLQPRSGCFGSAGCVGAVCWFIWGHSEPSHSCVRARVSSTNSCIPAVHRSPLQKLYRCFLCFGTVDAFGSVSSINQPDRIDWFDWFWCFRAALSVVVFSLFLWLVTVKPVVWVSPGMFSLFSNTD